MSYPASQPEARSEHFAEEHSDALLKNVFGVTMIGVVLFIAACFVVMS